jgi:hypothetical protein
MHKYQIHEKQFHLHHLKKRSFLQRIEQQLHNFVLQKRISDFRNKIEHEICFDLPNAFWKRKQHVVDVSYEDNFSENQIPTKARPFQMNVELEQHCRLEIQDLKSKGLI